MFLDEDETGKGKPSGAWLRKNVGESDTVGGVLAPTSENNTVNPRRPSGMAYTTRELYWRSYKGVPVIDPEAEYKETAMKTIREQRRDDA